jgi:hypothetical protein
LGKPKKAPFWISAVDITWIKVMCFEDWRPAEYYLRGSLRSLGRCYNFPWSFK